MAAFGPSEIGSVLQGVGTLAGAFTVAYAAWLASNSFEGWRKQKLSERRIEQAERILTATYKARRALDIIRSPMMSGHEQLVAEKHLEQQDYWSSTDPDRKKSMITTQANYNRLNAALDERRALDECLPMARALFGEEVEVALDTIGRQFHLVRIAVEANGWDEIDKELRREIREDLYNVSGRDRENPMNKRIAEQVAVIERVCIPVLRLEGN